MIHSDRVPKANVAVSLTIVLVFVSVYVGLYRYMWISKALCPVAAKSKAWQLFFLFFLEKLVAIFLFIHMLSKDGQTTFFCGLLEVLKVAQRVFVSLPILTKSTRTITFEESRFRALRSAHQMHREGTTCTIIVTHLLRLQTCVYFCVWCEWNNNYHGKMMTFFSLLTGELFIKVLIKLRKKLSNNKNFLN